VFDSYPSQYVTLDTVFGPRELELGQRSGPIEAAGMQCMCGSVMSLAHHCHIIKVNVPFELEGNSRATGPSLGSLGVWKL
jgi:hypothetical protein